MSVGWRRDAEKIPDSDDGVEDMIIELLLLREAAQDIMRLNEIDYSCDSLSGNPSELRHRVGCWGRKGLLQVLRVLFSGGQLTEVLGLRWSTLRENLPCLMRTRSVSVGRRNGGTSIYWVHIGVVRVNASAPSSTVAASSSHVRHFRI